MRSELGPFVPGQSGGAKHDDLPVQADCPTPAAPIAATQDFAASLAQKLAAGALETVPAPPAEDAETALEAHHGLAADALRRQGLPLKRKIVIFEVEGGSDKGPDGHRADSLPIKRALEQRGWACELLFYSDDAAEALLQRVAAGADGFISRINPGRYPRYTERRYLRFCRGLIAAGCVPMPHPGCLTSYGAKDALVALRHTPAGLPDTYAYYDAASLLAQFPASLAHSDRVLKQNRGSTGQGIWLVRPADPGARAAAGGGPLPPDTPVLCTEMVDNHTESWTLQAFMRFCFQYIAGPNGMLVDQRFLPRITEGEVRVLMINDAPVSVVHKRPTAGHYSATLFSGASYSYEPPGDPKWAALIGGWRAAMPQVRALLGGHAFPLIWTADFILDTAAGGGDAYVLGEMNCSCVGFSTQLQLAHDVAEAAIRLVEAAAVAGAGVGGVGSSSCSAGSAGPCSLGGRRGSESGSSISDASAAALEQACA